MGKTDG
jgi:hypothetical protein